MVIERAAVSIGVGTTGGLPHLHDAARGAREVGKWALAQGMRPDLVQVLTDEKRPIDPTALKRAIRKIVDIGTVDQLLVYFAGHGVNNNYGEYWLLSDAPGDSQAAVNVEGTVRLARHCGIPHVVLVSDACRTAAEGIQAQAVGGSEIFPNTGGTGIEACVDIFFACTVGRPALEIKDPQVSAGAYRAIYTKVLLAALQGNEKAVLERLQEGAEKVGIVRPRPLKKFLRDEVPTRLGALAIAGVHQVPDARITSDEDAWISRFPLASLRRVRNAPIAGRHTRRVHIETIATLTESLVRATLRSEDPTLEQMPAVLRGRTAGAKVLANSILQQAATFGPAHYETGCGFKVRGNTIRAAYPARRARAELLGDPPELVRMHDVDPPGASVLLVFGDGTGAVLPAIPQFLAALTFEEGELAAVSYEPSDITWRWKEYSARAEELRILRATVAASARQGVFRLDAADAETMARKMQLAKGVDPSMALYAAYAFDALQNRGRLEELRAYLASDLGGLRPFDIEMLAHGLDGTQVAKQPHVLPFVPMLSQGWPLLSAYRVLLPREAAEISTHLRPSLWTLFNPKGVSLLRQVIASGEVG